MRMKWRNKRFFAFDHRVMKHWHPSAQPLSGAFGGGFQVGYSGWEFPEVGVSGRADP